MCFLQRQRACDLDFQKKPVPVSLPLRQILNPRVQYFFLLLNVLFRNVSILVDGLGQQASAALLAQHCQLRYHSCFACPMLSLAFWLENYISFSCIAMIQSLTEVAQRQEAYFPSIMAGEACGLSWAVAFRGLSLVLYFQHPGSASRNSIASSNSSLQGTLQIQTITST